MAVLEIPESPESIAFENVAEKLNSNDLERIGEEVVSGYDRDLVSISDLINIRIEYNKLFDLKHEKKTFPWVNAANIKLPVIIQPSVNFQSRASINLFPSSKLVKVIPINLELSSQSKALRVARYMNWQILFDMPNYRSSWNKTLVMLAKDGYAFRKIFWDSEQERVISDFILPQDFVVNYYTKDLETSKRYTQVMHLTINEIKIKAEQGIYVNTEDLEEPSHVKTDMTTLNNKENMGHSEPEADYATPRDILEQHTVIKLKENDEIRQPFIVTVDRETKKVMRIIDRRNPISGEPMCYFINLDFMPNPDSLFGYGFGQLLLGANKGMNGAINQMMDAGHLSTVRGGWVLKGSQVSRGNTSFTMGEFKEFSVRSDDSRKAIFPLEFAPPSSVLMDLVQFLQGYIDNLTTVTETVSGEAPKSDTTATAASIAIEASAKVFTSIQKSIHSKIQKEYKKIYTLDGIFIDQDQYMEIVATEIQKEAQERGTSVPELEIDAVKDFNSRLGIEPVSDPNIISEGHRIAKAEALAQMVAQNPFLAQDPQAVQIVMQKRAEALDISPAILESLNQVMGQAVQTAQNQATIAAQQANQIEQQDTMTQENELLEKDNSEIEAQLKELG